MGTPLAPKTFNGVGVLSHATRAYSLLKHKDLMAQDPDLSPADREQMQKNLKVMVLANNRRVDVSLNTGQQSTRRYPFNAQDFLALTSTKSEETKPRVKPPPKK
jgi:hypothetical protein